MTGSWVAQDQAIATLSRFFAGQFLPSTHRDGVLCEFRTEHVPVQTDSLAWNAFN